MTMRNTSTILVLSFLILWSLLSLSSNASKDLVRKSCMHASYPHLCLRTLSTYSGPAKTPGDLAKAAVEVSLSRSRKVSACLSRISGGSQRERGAVKDCIDQISDSVDELRRTLSELKHLRKGTFRWQMSDAETWVSAALTNEDTCLDGFQSIDGKIKAEVKRKITNVARVTSNALYLITRLDQSRRQKAP
ncbi:Pectinesterase inhibitor domain [Dillenia turbinata]|uniref:Pectinesterase inhibitor domain n=1 Tax=Dillenia turbinata TaxID=194707 RepID=A0AAN8VUG3_9MAGN